MEKRDSRGRKGLVLLVGHGGQCGWKSMSGQSGCTDEISGEPVVALGAPGRSFGLLFSQHWGMDLVKWWLGLTFTNTPLVAEQTLDWWGVGTSGSRCVARQAKWRGERVAWGGWEAARAHWVEQEWHQGKRGRGLFWFLV